MSAAEAPNYQYIELAYGSADVDVDVSGLGSADIDQDGYELEGSYSFFDDRLWLLGSYTDLSGEEAGVDLDVETISFGIGSVFKLSDSATIDASVIYREDEFSALGTSADADGAGVAVGTRLNAGILEIFGRLGYLEGDYEGSLLVDIGVLFNIGEHFGISGSYELLDVNEQGVDIQFSQLQLGGRFQF